VSYLNGYYLNNPHVSQFDGSTYEGSNCTPASFANGINAVTGGRVKRTAAQIRSMVARREETNPDNPGWSQEDGQLAMSRLYPPLRYEVRTGRGWNQLVKDHESGLYLTVMGDNDQFSGGCAGSFDGLHCIGVSPITRILDGREQWWVDQPLCPTGKWEYRKDIYDYAAKLYLSMFYGMFLTPVPRSPTLWGVDVPQNIQAVNPSGWTVGKAVVWATGQGFGTVINMKDLHAAFAAIGLGYGLVIEPKDVQALVALYKGRPGG
jgi:hypothetical protein